MLAQVRSCCAATLPRTTTLCPKHLTTLQECFVATLRSSALGGLSFVGSLVRDVLLHINCVLCYTTLALLVTEVCLASFWLHNVEIPTTQYRLGVASNNCSS